jgi:hypothetical protein
MIKIDDQEMVYDNQLAEQTYVIQEKIKSLWILAFQKLSTDISQGMNNKQQIYVNFHMDVNTRVMYQVESHLCTNTYELPNHF